MKMMDMKLTSTTKVVLILLFFGLSLYLAHRLSYNSGQDVGYKNGYSCGFEESEIATSRSIYRNQKDSFLTVNLPTEKIIDAVDFKTVFDRISTCNDCQNIEACEVIYKEELSKIINAFILEYGKDQGMMTSQILLSQAKFNDVREQVTDQAFHEFMALNCVSSINKLVLDSNVQNMNTKGNSLTSTYTTSSNFAASIGTVLCGHFMRSLYGSLCAGVITQIVSPIDDHLRKISIIEDINTAQSVILKHIRYDIAELCTVEDEFTSESTVQKEGLFGKDGWFGSTSDLSVSIASKIKAGIDLKKHFVINVDHSSKLVHIEVGHPEILSHETQIVNRYIDNGVLTKDINEGDLERAEEQAAELNYSSAISSGILDKASKNTLSIVYQIISPMVSNSVQNYELLVTTKEGKSISENFELTPIKEGY